MRPGWLDKSFNYALARLLAVPITVDPETNAQGYEAV